MYKLLCVWSHFCRSLIVEYTSGPQFHSLYFTSTTPMSNEYKKDERKSLILCLVPSKGLQQMESFYRKTSLLNQRETSNWSICM